VSARDTSSDLDDDLAALEAELRYDGALSFATCETLRNDRRFDGLESCLRFLGCIVFAVDPAVPPIPRLRRVTACRLMLLGIYAHTPTPRWTPMRVEQLVEAAMQIPGAELSDLVQAQFALLAETVHPPGNSQMRYLHELGCQIATQRRIGHAADDFVWIAVRLADPVLPHTVAQEYFAAQVLTNPMRAMLDADFTHLDTPPPD